MFKQSEAWLLLVQSFTLYIPMLAANQGPGLARMMRLPLSFTPVSPNLLGEGKTLAAYYAGPLLGICGTYLVGAPESWYVGGLTGLGAILGDHVKSFFKRRLGYARGSKFALDRVDYVLGGSAVAWFITDVHWQHMCVILPIAWIVHLLGNRASYALGLRDTPH